jgi:hypothetical protein
LTFESVPRDVGAVEIETAIEAGLAPKRRNAREVRTLRDGRYWARTSDLRLVEAALSQLS